MSPNRRDFLASVVGMTALGTGCVGLSADSGDSSATPTNDGSRSATATSPTTAAASSQTASPTATTTPAASTTTATTPNETMRTDTPSGRTRTTGTTETVDGVPVREPPACDGSLHRLSYPAVDEVRYGSMSGFSLTVSEKSVAFGETITFRLENTSETTQTTGNKRKYDIQRRTDDGWLSIYWVPENAAYTAIGISHPPGSGFTWTFPFTRDGLEQPTQFNTPYSVCGPLPPGEYRFVYWGVTSAAERESNFETESAIGVRFTVERSGTATTKSG